LIDACSEHVSDISDVSLHSTGFVNTGNDLGNSIAFELAPMEASHVSKRSLQLSVAQIHKVIFLTVSYGIVSHILTPTSDAFEKPKQFRVFIK
jgi:hypothetical protein